MRINRNWNSALTLKLSDSPLDRNLTWHRPPSGERLTPQVSPEPSYLTDAGRVRDAVDVDDDSGGNNSDDDDGDDAWHTLIASVASRDKASETIPRLHPIVGDDGEGCLSVSQPPPPTCLVRTVTGRFDKRNQSPPTCGIRVNG